MRSYVDVVRFDGFTVQGQYPDFVSDGLARHNQFELAVRTDIGAVHQLVRTALERLDNKAVGRLIPHNTSGNAKSARLCKAIETKKYYEIQKRHDGTLRLSGTRLASRGVAVVFLVFRSYR